MVQVWFNLDYLIIKEIEVGHFLDHTNISSSSLTRLVCEVQETL